eukprot:TRINITY_DN11489_c0_g1_i2.p1 TRINITY_DN11489_c0_g1~~TRINITY_DN11489_c0_g1_i2.p1  ORF type:complete len:313 (-),score=38.01 TRINITY_DN11489_c0_g1_i2:11-949(-)
MCRAPDEVRLRRRCRPSGPAGRHRGSFQAGFAIAASCLYRQAGAQTNSVYCEWHLDYFLRERINYTENPWSFQIDSKCTALSLMTVLWGSIDDAGAAALAEALKRSAGRLEELSLGYNTIGDAGAQALAAALQHLPQLRALHLGWNSIGNAGATAIAGALKYVPKLRELNFFWNSIGPSGAAALAMALQHLPHLSVLSLGWNNVGDTGAQALAAALAADKAPLLAELRIDWSNIGDVGAEALAAALGRQKKLNILRAKWNNYGDVGATSLARSVLKLEHARNDGSGKDPKLSQRFYCAQEFLGSACVTSLIQ